MNDNVTVDQPKTLNSIIGAGEDATNWHAIVGHLAENQGLLEIGSVLSGSPDALSLTVTATEATAAFVLLEGPIDTGGVGSGGVDASVARSGVFVATQLALGPATTFTATLVDTLRQRGILLEGADNYQAPS